ncbi:MAG: hypothetical protein QOK42_2234 [Frankiaceae bacterium]|nr:hypothetical protein [Frankiaceae bacterium]
MPPVTTRAPSVALRAGLVALLLVGFYLLALLVVAGLAGVAVFAFAEGSAAAGAKFGFITVVVAAALARAIFSLERSQHEDSSGLILTRQGQPEIWGLIDEVARGLGTPPPHQLRMVDDVNASVSQDSRLLGLVPGPRNMTIGLALMECITVDELRAVLAHEFGHYTGGDTRLGPLVYRANVTVSRAVDHLTKHRLLRRLFQRYAALVHRASLAVRRRQEISADLNAARVAGRSAHESALRGVHAGAAAWDFYLDNYVVPLLNEKVRPANLYAGFTSLLADPERRTQLHEARNHIPDSPAHPFDSHPPLGERLRALAEVADQPRPGDDRIAATLVRDRETVGGQITTQLLGHLREHRIVPSIEQAAAIYAIPALSAGLALLDAVAAVDGGERPGTIGRALDLVGAGRGTELRIAVTHDRRSADDPALDVANTLAWPLTAVVNQYLVDKTGARFRVSWSGPVELVATDGAAVALYDRIHAALLDVDKLGRLRSDLAALGVDLAAPPIRDIAPPTTDVIRAVLPDARIGGQRGGRADLVLSDLRLLVLPYAAGAGRGRAVARALREADDDKRRVQTEARLARLRGSSPEQVSRWPGVVTHRWEDLQRVALGGSAKQPHTFAISLTWGDDPSQEATYALVDSAATYDVMLEMLARAVGGDRLFVSRS